METLSRPRADAPPREIALLLNGQAGSVRPDDVDRLADVCRAGGLTVVEIACPMSPEEMSQTAARLAVDVPGLLVVGGDGALNAAIRGCIGRPVAVGMLPRGTVNVWALEIGLPFRPELAVAALRAGRVGAVDVGRISWPTVGAEEHFLLMAGLGFDGEVVRLVDPKLKRAVGRGAFALASIAAYLRHDPYVATIEVDGVERSLRLTQLVVANCRRYGGDLPLAAAADLADGWLDLWTLGPAPRLRHAARFARIVVSASDPGDRLLPARARTIRITSEHDVAVQLDGDPIPPRPGPIEVSVIPGALRAWFPAVG